MSDLVLDLVQLARYLLKPKGRLVFFLPTVAEDYSPLDLPVVEGMVLVSDSVQDFGKWARRVSPGGSLNVRQVLNEHCRAAYYNGEDVVRDGGGGGAFVRGSGMEAQGSCIGRKSEHDRRSACSRSSTFQGEVLHVLQKGRGGGVG